MSILGSVTGMGTIRWLLFGGKPSAWLARQPFWLLVVFIVLALAALFGLAAFAPLNPPAPDPKIPSDPAP